MMQSIPVKLWGPIKSEGKKTRNTFFFRDGDIKSLGKGKRRGSDSTELGRFGI